MTVLSYSEIFGSKIGLFCQFEFKAVVIPTLNFHLVFIPDGLNAFQSRCGKETTIEEPVAIGLKLF